MQKKSDASLVAPVPQIISEAPVVTKAPLHCVLVHGTWAANAEWIKADSKLTKELLKLDPNGVTVSNFIWSGHNNHFARVDAAQTLAESLKLEAAKFPETRFLLIGHSHGGSVVMNAVSGIPESQRAGVVCLGTPFFHVRPRSTAMLTWIRGGITAMEGGAFFWISGILVSKIQDWEVSRRFAEFSHWFYSLMPGSEGVWGGLGAVSGGLTALWLLLYCSVSALIFSSGGPPKAQVRAIERWKSISPVDVKTLCIWFGLDEAYWWLRIVRIVAEWMHCIISYLSAFVMPVITAASTIAAFWLGIKSGIATAAHLGELASAAAVGQVFFYVGCAVAIVPMLIWGAALFVSIVVSPVGVGSISAMDHLWLDVHTQRVPQISEVNIDHEELPLHSGNFFRKFMAALPFVSGPIIHSRVYLDTKTPEIIKKWYLKNL
ncbi:alpha/beta hydrolase [Pseudomonas sp. C1C7]|uniref:esterase/lipase family protein n=1 Tax=Pseudomonas sp. C1C7 TaxID=2735272 RepID=UPI001586A60A|nr:alpha/beta hydrolase [Pseudomonas sp. C1C7]